MQPLPLQQGVITHSLVGQLHLLDQLSPSHTHMDKVRTSLCMQYGWAIHLLSHMTLKVEVLLAAQVLALVQVFLLLQPHLPKQITHFLDGPKVLVEQH